MNGKWYQREWYGSFDNELVVVSGIVYLLIKWLFKFFHDTRTLQKSSYSIEKKLLIVTFKNDRKSIHDHIDRNSFGINILPTLCNNTVFPKWPCLYIVVVDRATRSVWKWTSFINYSCKCNDNRKDNYLSPKVSHEKKNWNILGSTKLCHLASSKCTNF